MFQLTAEEARRSRPQIVTLNAEVLEFTADSPGRSSRRGKHVKYMPHAFMRAGGAGWSVTTAGWPGRGGELLWPAGRGVHQGVRQVVGRCGRPSFA